MKPLDGDSFENEVLRVARALWPSAGFTGPVIEDGLERDGIFETEEVTNLLECTTERSKSKAEKDLKKLRGLIAKRSGRAKPSVGWLVTQHEPTADQRGLLRANESINLVSLATFRSRLIDAFDYLGARDDAPFGSARDPVTGTTSFTEVDVYVDNPMRSQSPGRELLDAGRLVDRLVDSRRCLVLGDYGMGKSMLLRDVYSRLAKRYRTGDGLRFPVHINLREHQGQTDHIEMLERHARSIGFPNSHQLVRAWRAGRVDLMLDGFDEIGTLGWSGPTKDVRAIRRRSVQAVRSLISESSSDVGVLISGRSHFFDSAGEMLGALGAESFEVVDLQPFGATQIDQLLSRYEKHHGRQAWIPAWVPARPLLLSHIAARGLIAEMASIAPELDPASGWDRLLDMITAREALIEAGIDGQTLRTVLERVASVARSRGDGLGPIEFDDTVAAFHSVVGHAPDENATVLLQRLPGLGAPDAQNGSRRFIDGSLADAARVGDFVRVVLDPYSAKLDDQWKHCLGRLGVEIAAERLQSTPGAESLLAVAIDRLGGDSLRSVAVADMLRTAAQGGFATEATSPIQVGETVLENLDWLDANADLRRVEFADCIIDEIQLSFDSDGDQRMPTFRRCLIGDVVGRVSQKDLPAGKFVDCEVNEYSDSTATTGAILDSSMPTGARVLLTILKKLYRQAGGGRKEKSLRRGLPPADRPLVRDVIKIAESEGLVLSGRAGSQTVLMPVRSLTGRVNEILDSPAASADPAIVACSKLG